MEFANDKPVLTAIKAKWGGDKISNELSVYIGPVSSGAAVISNKVYIENKIRHQRKLIAIDMKSCAIFYCSEYCTKPRPIPILIKSFLTMQIQTKLIICKNTVLQFQQIQLIIL